MAHQRIKRASGSARRQASLFEALADPDSSGYFGCVLESFDAGKLGLDASLSTSVVKN